MMGAMAVDLLCEGKSNRVVGFSHGEFKDFDINEALGMNKDQMTQLLDQLELSGKIERHTHAKSTTYSLAHASGR